MPQLSQLTASDNSVRSLARGLIGDWDRADHVVRDAYCSLLLRASPARVARPLPWFRGMVRSLARRRERGTASASTQA